MNLHEWSWNEGSAVRMSTVTLGGGVGLSVLIFPSGCYSPSLSRFNNANQVASSKWAMPSKTAGISWIWHLLGLAGQQLSHICGWSFRHVSASLSNILADGLEHGQQSMQTSQVFSGSASHKYRSDQKTFCLAGADPQMVVCMTQPDWRLHAGGRGRPPTVGARHKRTPALMFGKEKWHESKTSHWQPWYI